MKLFQDNVSKSTCMSFGFPMWLFGITASCGTVELNTMSHVGAGKGVAVGIEAASLFDLTNREPFQAAAQTTPKATIAMYLVKLFRQFI